MSEGKPSLTPSDLLNEHLAVALRVTAVEIYVDQSSLDRLFIIHTEDREPIQLRVAPVDLATILRDLSEAIARSLN